MSKQLRSQNLWPASQYARFLWLVLAVWEDVVCLADLYRSSKDQGLRLVFARHVLVDLDAVDELIKELHKHVRTEEAPRLSEADAATILEAFHKYHRTLEPLRQSLKEIRNYIGAHRTGIPWEKAPDAGIAPPPEWGKWEHYLVGLEDRCDLKGWQSAFDAVYALIATLKDFNLTAWYSFSDTQSITFVMPVLPPGYYPSPSPEPNERDVNPSAA